MNQRTSTAVEPADFDLAGCEFLRIAADISPASLTADRQQGRVLADQQGPLSVVATGHIHHEPLLQKERRVKIDQPQQIDLKRSIRRPISIWFGCAHQWLYISAFQARLFVLHREAPAWQTS
jgi:hypothetical protein